MNHRLNKTQNIKIKLICEEDVLPAVNPLQCDVVVVKKECYAYNWSAISDK